MSMKNLFIFIIAVSLLVGVRAQFDHTLRTAVGLSLGAASNNPQNGISQFSAVANDQVIGGDCRCNRHAISNVRINNGPLNSGTYFEVTLTNTANATLSYYFGDIGAPFDILSVLSNGANAQAIGAVGICNPGLTTCTYDYYCDIYPNVASLELVVCSDASDNTLNDAINFYTVGVRQYTANVQTISSTRTLTQSSTVVDAYATANPGPSNFVHYYHNLVATPAEAGASSRLFIEATNWAGPTGSAYICVSFDSLVANTNSLSGVVTSGGDINGPNIIANSVFTNDPAGCQTYCQQGTINGAGSAVVASFPGCFGGCGFPANIWIGVRTPSATTGSTYTVKIAFRDFSVPDLLSINSFITEIDADITDTCDGQIGDFSCENYYHITSRPSAGAGQPGPYLAVEVFAVHEGSVAAYLSDGHLAGDQSLCGGCSIFASCNEVSSTASVPDCWLVVQPCQWTSARDWILTVQGLNQDQSGRAIEYGARFDAGSWPVTSVTADEWLTGAPNFGEVLPAHYHHYTVSFTDADLYDDSYFEVELYTSQNDDRLGFAWKFGSFADSGTCYGYDGACFTDNDCTDDQSASNTGMCRFLFLPCPIEVDYTDFISSSAGAKVSQLNAGTYYFAVWGLGGSGHYSTNVHYTLLFNLRRSIPLFDAVTFAGKVFEFDYSPQFYVTYPADPTISQIRVTISEVTNGDLTFYVQCAALAGDCPCWSSLDHCNVGGFGDISECSLTVKACECPERMLYLSVYNSGNQENDSQFGFNRFYPASFTLTTNILHYPMDEITPIDVARSVVRVTEVLYNSDEKEDQIDYYWLSTTNIDPKIDALVVRLSGLVTDPASYSDNNVLTLTVSKGDVPGGCGAEATCTVPFNSYDSTSILGECDLVFQPCYNPSYCFDSTCTAQASFTTLSWDYSDTFYVSVELKSGSNVEYTLDLQVINQAPLALTDSTPFYGYVGMDQYVHFMFSVPSSASSNARLSAFLYKNFDKQEALFLYVNYASPAGRTSECFDNDCYECNSGYYDRQCVFEADPCELSNNRGTYYLSVRGDAANTLQYSGQEKVEFTLTVSIYEPVALLDSNAVGIPISDSVWDGQTAYYSVTVPTLVNGNVVGRVLTLEVGEVLAGNLYFEITQDQPSQDCGCNLGAQINTGDINQWRRYPCELRSGAVYYIAVSGVQDAACDPVGYVVHARIYDVVQQTISLTGVDSQIVGSYDTTTFTIGYNEWTALKFTTNNVVAGAVLNVDVTQPSTGNGFTRPIEVRLSSGDIATRVGYNGRSDVGPNPNDATCVGNYVCTGELRSTCSIFVPACDLPSGTTTWFLTFTGEDLPVAAVSDPISISIRLINPQAVITFPAVTDYLTTSTSVSVSTSINTINQSYGKVQFTSVANAATGINAGDSLIISYSGNSPVDFYVSYGDETGVGCDADCLVTSQSNPTCTFRACANIANAVWYVGISSNNAQTGTFSVRRSQSPTNAITVTPLAISSTVTSFTALGTDQWRYHSINVPASTTSHYELQIGGGANFNDVVYVGTSSNSAVWLPGLVFTPTNGVNEFTISTGGVLGSTCGGAEISAIAGTCCYDLDTSVFAVVGNVGDYTLQVQVVQFADGNPTSVNLPSTTTRTTTGGKVAWFSFTLPAGADLWFDLSVSSGSARIYLNKGALAGSDAISFLTDFGACWYNDGLIQTICPSTIDAGFECGGFIPSDCYSCLAENEGSTFYFAVIPVVDATYSLTVLSQPRVQTLTTSANNNLLFPSTGTQSIKINDDTTDNNDFAPYSHFVWSWNKAPYSITQFLPVVDDPAISDPFTYPYVKFVISNVVNIGTTTSADDLVDFFVNVGDLAGISDCYGGRDITQGGNEVPCLENNNGAAAVDPVTGDITCSVLVCDLSCPEDVYFSIARNQQTFQAVSFSVTIAEVFTQVATEVDIVPVTLNNNGFTINYNSNVNTLNDVVYFRFTGTAVNNFLESQTQFLDLIIDNLVGTNTVIDVRAYNGNECQNFNDASDLCGSLTTGELCFINFDPCYSTEIFVDSDSNQDFFFRVSRIGGGSTNWGFRFTGKLLTATPIDAQATTLTVTNSGAHYSADKEIFSGDWHFYEFNVANGNFGGYNTLSATVDSLLCNDPAFDLEVYVSWKEDNNGIVDVARPNRWPTRTCFVDSGLAPATFSIDNWCNTWGGVYRIAIYAEYGLQNYDDPVLGVNYPVVYSISFDVAHQAATEIGMTCDNEVHSFGYYTVRPDASNRGSRLVFEIESEGDDGTLYVSKNANPYEVVGNCAWGTPLGGGGNEPFTTVNGDYYCSITGPGCSVVVPTCEFDDDTWFIYLDGNSPGLTYTLYVYEYRVYTPVISLASSHSYTTAGVVNDMHYQYYNFLVDNTIANSFFYAALEEAGCNGCDLTMFLTEGPAGFSSGDGDNGAHSQVCGDCEYGNCDCYDQTCSTGSDGACLLFGGCSITGGQLYIGVRGSSQSSCPYFVSVSATVPAVQIVENREVCTNVFCGDFYQLVSSTSVSDFTDNSVTIFISNHDNADDLNVYINFDGVAGDDCNVVSDICASGDDCSYTLNCIVGSVYVSVFAETCQAGAQCGGQSYSISYTYSAVTVQTVTVGGSVTGAVAKVTSQAGFYTSDPVQFSTAGGSSCSTSCGVAFAAGTYYLYNAQGVQLSSFSNQALSTNFASVSFVSGSYQTFSIAVPTGVSSFTVEFADFNYPTSAVDIGYSVSFGSPDLGGCAACGIGSSFLEPTGCNSDSASIVVSCAQTGTYYLSLIDCDLAACDKTFRARVVFDSPRALISGTHQTAYTQVISSASCENPSGSYGYYVQADGPLWVNIRQVGPTSSAATVSLRPADDCAPVSACTATSTSDGASSSCGVQDGCNNYACASGLYYVDVDLTGTIEGSGFELQVVNQWVSLSGSTSGTILGAARHFYSLSNTGNNALTFKLTVNSGPALRFVVFDGCGQSATFSETKIAAFGDTYTWVPTLAKHSGSNTYYVELYSDFASGDNDEWARDNNDRAQTPTSYTLQAITGAGNCAAPPSSGFCADSSIAGINVWSKITGSSVWKFVNTALKDQEAQCLYGELSERCVYPTDECRYWLKVYSCLETFPQCDGSGFQLAMCVDVRNEVEAACGAFPIDYPFQCCRDRYVRDSSPSTCYNIPPPPPPPPTFDDHNGSQESSFPPPFEVPVFPTIYATMPPASNFYTFSHAGKDIEVEVEFERQVANSASSSSVLVFLVLIVAVLLM